MYSSGASSCVFLGCSAGSELVQGVGIDACGLDTPVGSCIVVGLEKSSQAAASSSFSFFAEESIASLWLATSRFVKKGARVFDDGGPNFAPRQGHTVARPMQGRGGGGGGGRIGK